MSESYTIGGDELFDLYPPFFIGQTFSPLQEHKLEFIDLNLKRQALGGDVWCTLHDLAADPNMVGGGISYTKSVTWAPESVDGVHRVRFKLRKQTVKVGETYGIRVASKIEPPWNKHYVQYDGALATYPRGKRFTKNSLLDPPAWYDGSDLIFTEFGEPPTPPTPPDPPITKFTILAVEYYITATGVRIVVTTNVPCHLYMIWTRSRPWTHRISGIFRGEEMVRDVRYCFDNFTANEQIQDGDTIYHTFIKEPWRHCETRWFTFKAKVNDGWSTSSTPIFSLHRIEPTWVHAPACYQLTPLNAVDRPFNHYQEYTFSIKACRTYNTDQITLGLNYLPSYPPPTSMRIALYNADALCKPLGDPIASAIIPIDLPLDPAYKKHTAYIPLTTLTLGQNYAVGMRAEPPYTGPPYEQGWTARAEGETCDAPDYEYLRWIVSPGVWSDWYQQSGANKSMYDIPQLL